jgi:hypothetical protein
VATGNESEVSCEIRQYSPGVFRLVLR